MTVHERRGRWYDELEVGDVYRHRPGRTISEADNALFCGLTMNMQSLHWDAEFAATSEFGQRLVNSLMTLAITAGLSVADLTEGTTIANLGFGEIEFPKPGVLRRHAERGDGDHRQAPVAVAARPGHRRVRAPCPQPARRGRLSLPAFRARTVRRRPRSRDGRRDVRPERC
jgi:hypothetical protein